MRFPRRGLYAITPDRGFAAGELEAAVTAAVEGGAVAVQFRNKHSSSRRRRECASALKDICRNYAIPLIVNDDVALAAEICADGVHVGKDDAEPAAARDALGPKAIIGVSCYSSPQRAIDATAAGADYVAFGSFFPSLSKPDAPLCPLPVLHAARASLSVPVVAIGGITAKNGAALIQDGADVLAVIQDLFGKTDIRSAAATLARLFE